MCTTCRGSPTIRTRRRRAASPGEAPGATGASGKDLVIPVPEGTVVIDERGLDRRPGGRGHARRRGAPAAAGAGATRPSRDLGTACPAPPSSGEDGEDRTVTVELRTVADVGSGGAAERGQVHAAGSPHRRQAQDRQLSLHHADAEPRRGGRGHGPVRGGRHPRAGRGRQRGQGAGAPVPAAHRAMPGARPGGRPGGGGPRHRPGDAASPSSRPTTPSWHGARRSWSGTKADLVEDAALGDRGAGAGGHRRSRR